MHTQHPTQWAEYTTIKSDNERDQFFIDVPIAFKNSIKTHLSSSSLGVERQIIFDIDKNIIDTIVGDMLFDPTDECDSDEDVVVQDHVFGSEVELNVVMCLCSEAVASTKSQVLALFKGFNLRQMTMLMTKCNSHIR
jgi:hypothetical protein